MGEKILAFEINDTAYDLDYPEDIPEIERALKKLKRGEHLNQSDSQGERFPS
jgi:hypothetical protein